jgi:hypothetical protein
VAAAAPLTVAQGGGVDADADRVVAFLRDGA